MLYIHTKFQRNRFIGIWTQANAQVIVYEITYKGFLS